MEAGNSVIAGALMDIQQAHKPTKPSMLKRPCNGGTAPRLKSLSDFSQLCLGLAY
jgi:hypothetical protein